MSVERAPLYEIKSYGMVLSFDIKKTKLRIIQAGSLKHNIKKKKFPVLDKVNLFRLGRGQSCHTR